MIDYDGYELFEQDNVGKMITIQGDGFSFTNADIDSENFELNESLCSQNTLKIGVCESASIKFRIGYGTESLINKSITVNVRLQGREDTLPLGVYTITSDALTADRRHRDIVAYDALNSILKRSMAAWYNNIFPDMTTSVTVKQFRDSFFNYFGIAQEQITLINDNAVLKKTIDTDQLTGKDILESICEMNACFGHITRTGTFRYVYLDELDTETAIVIGDNRSYRGIKYEDFVTEPITKLQIRQEENDVGVVVGSGTNDYVIEGNPLLFGMSIETLTPIANNILAKLQITSYRPAKIEVRGNPCIEVGDGIQAETTFGNVMTYVLQRKMKGVQSLVDTFTANGTRVFHNNTNSIHSQLIQLRGKSNVLERTIDETRSELTDMDAETRSIITQTADTLQVQINELYSELDGETQLYYTQEVPTLLNYPAWDFTYNIPCNDTVQLRDDLKFEYTEEYYRKNLRAIAYDETHSVTYRFIKSNGVYYWDEVSNTETSIIMSRLSTLEATTEGIQTEVSAVTLDLEDNYYTKSETDSKITQTSESITAAVSATYTTKTATNELSAQVQLKVNRADLSSEISASAGTITLNSNRLVINSSYFGLTADGYITSTGGTIGGFTIGSTFLRNGMTSISDTTNNGVYVGTDGIALGKGAFKVTNGGALTANNASISGEINATSLSLGAGVTVPYSKISGTPDLTVYVAKDGTIGSTPGPGATGFKVSSAGLLTASNAVIYGTIYASAGTFTGTVTTSNITASGGYIGNFTLDTALKNGMTSLSDTTHNGVYLGSDGIALGKGAFKVTNAGALTATNANIRGTVNTGNLTASGGTVGCFIINADGFTYNDLGHTYSVLRNTSELAWSLGDNSVAMNVRGSTTNITASGTVNIGTSATQTVKVKNRTVAWRQLRAVDPSEYVLVED